MTENILINTIIKYKPKKVKSKSKNPTLKTLLKQLSKNEADYRVRICLTDDKHELLKIANNANFSDFRHIAINKIILAKINKWNWLKIKPRKLLKVLKPDVLKIQPEIFKQYVQDVLIHVLDKYQIKYLYKNNFYPEILVNQIKS